MQDDELVVVVCLTPFLCIIVDEITSFNKEVIHLCVWFVNHDIREDFFFFFFFFFYNMPNLLELLLLVSSMTMTN